MESASVHSSIEYRGGAAESPVGVDSSDEMSTEAVLIVSTVAQASDAMAIGA